MAPMDTSPAPSSPLAYGVTEACAVTGLSRPYLYRLMAAGSIPFRKCGARRLILAADLQRFLESLPEGQADCQSAA